MGKLILNGNEYVGGGLHTYSTEEKVVGTWIDGNAIYEKVVQITSGISGGVEVNLAHGIANIDEIISYFVKYTRSSNTRFGQMRMPIGSSSSTSTSVNGAWSFQIIDVTASNIIASIGDSLAGTIDSITAIIQYTKSTS